MVKRARRAGLIGPAMRPQTGVEPESVEVPPGPDWTRQKRSGNG